MKRLLIAATALSMLAAPALSFAQDHHDEHGGGRPAGGGGGGGGAPRAAPAPQAAPQAPRGPQGGGGQPGGGFRPQGQGAPQGQPQFRSPPPQGQFPGGQGSYRPQGQQFPGGQGGYRPQQGQPNYRPQPQQFPGGQGGYRPQAGQPGGQYRGGPQNGQGGYRPQGGQQGGQFQRYRGGGQAFSFGGRSFMRYRAEPYRFPPQYGGWEHHGWRRGEWLPSVFISPYYFIDDFSDYDLWQPDYGYQWIRVGADAVLVNLDTGQVADVVPGIYY